jgi:hypothetical protein
VLKLRLIGFNDNIDVMIREGKMDEIPKSDPNQYMAVKIRTGSIPGQKRDMLIAGALILVAACGVFMLLVAGIQILSSTAVDQMIALVNPTSTPSPSPTPPNPQLHPGLLMYTGKFDYPGIWEVGHTDDTLITSDYSVANGKYHWDLTAKDGVISYSTPKEKIEIPFDDYQVSVDTHMLSGPEDASYGVLFDFVDDNNYWEWAVSEDGNGRLDALVGGDWQDTAYQFSVPIKKGETNTLTIKVSKDLLYFYVNGALAGSYKNPDPGTSSFVKSKTNGLCADIYNAGDKVSIEFDNYVISVPPNFDE